MPVCCGAFTLDFDQPRLFTANRDVPLTPQMNALFQRLGDKRLPDGEHQQYETAEALQVGAVVAAEHAFGPSDRASRHVSSGPIVGRFSAWYRALSDHEIVSAESKSDIL